MRRKSSDWQYPAASQSERPARRSRSPRRESVWKRLRGLFGVEHSRRRRRSPASLSVSASELRSKRRRNSPRSPLAYAAALARWAFYKVADRKWRPLSFSEGLIWIAVGAVAIAFLLLLAKEALLIAAGVFLLMVVFAWRELGQK